jgi:hypothetical protein
MVLIDKIGKVQKMEKNKLLLLPFFAGLVLIVYSWCISYPLSINSVNDAIFNHVPVLYWISLPLLLTSMCMMALSFKNKYWKWIMTVGCVMTLYSLSYFYYMLSSSDANYFRGLTEYFIRTHNLDPSQAIHGYYQWPSFFILADITTSVSGLNLGNYEFLLFTIIGSLLSTALYLYASKVYNRGVSLALAAFFIVMFYFLNYQAVPFSLALGLLFLLFTLETRKKSTGIILTMLILYTSITITHAFVPLFFVLYLLLRSIVDRSKQYFRFFVLALVTYLVVQITLGRLSFAVNIVDTFVFHSEYSSIATSTLAPISVQFDVIAQLFSRMVTIAFGLLCFVGFVFLVIKRKLREIDKAIFLTGAVYSGLGIVLFTLGSRAIPLVFVPISLGVVYLYESRFRPYLKYLALILLILFVFVPIHLSFTSYPITFQTKEDLTTTNFMIEKYNWNSYSIVISDSGTHWYITPQVQGSTEIDTDLAPRFGLSNITTYNCIIYSIGLAKSLQMSNISIGETSQRILDRFSVVYDSGFSYIAEKSK